ncbi:amino acid adenylation domain-containing protein [Actinoplanes philippinensis]|uniref:amino acid adenylation domain-containing protein n=1 Tax=Actinoplanes philippinensis TaxID=35752 RepID=UPI0033C153C4
MTAATPVDLALALPPDDDPGRAAVVAADGSLTFTELEDRVEDLHRRLVRHGAGPEQIIGVRLPRGLDLVVALLAVWRSGAAYLPVDPELPEARQRFMLDDSRATLVIGPAGIEPVTAAPARPERAGPCPAGALAYVLYTSGSTGTPKAVAVTRAGVTNLMRGLADLGVYDGGRRTVAWNAGASFDASVQQWTRLMRGDTIVLLGTERTDPEALAALLRRHAVTDLDITPTHWGTVRDAVVAGRTGDTVPLRLLIGGEAIPEAMWIDLCRLAGRGIVEAMNVYGPTETTVDATAARILTGEPSIGRPLTGVRAYVLDEQLNPARTGELFLAGAGLARGYLHRPGLTARSFLPDVLAGDGSRMYRTGDRVSRRADGSLDFLGRLDRQVKLRGLRIEPGEVEAALAAQEAVRDVRVVLRDDLPGGDGLVAYCLVDEPGPEVAGRIARGSAELLPAHLRPAAVVTLSEFPRTANGKLDTAALPLPHRGVLPADADRPALPQDRVLAAAAGVLGLERVSADDDFFSLGGNSLHAAGIRARLRGAWGLRVPARLLFDHPRLGDFAAQVSELAERQHRQLIQEERS